MRRASRIRKRRITTAGKSPCWRNAIDHAAAAKRPTTSISCARRLGVHRMVMHPVLDCTRGDRDGVVRCVVFCVVWVAATFRHLDTTCRSMGSVGISGVGQRLQSVGCRPPFRRCEMLNLVRLACSFGLAFSSLGSGLFVDSHNGRSRGPLAVETCIHTEKHDSRTRVHFMVLASGTMIVSRAINQTPSMVRCVEAIHPLSRDEDSPGVLSVITGRPSPIDIPVSLPIASANQMHISVARSNWNSVDRSKQVRQICSHREHDQYKTSWRQLTKAHFDRNVSINYSHCRRIDGGGCSMCQNGRNHAGRIRKTRKQTDNRDSASSRLHFMVRRI